MTEYYKVLQYGSSPYYKMTWPTPSEDLPGRWVQVGMQDARNSWRRLEKCVWGLHAATRQSLLYWYITCYRRNTTDIYVLEFDKSKGFIDDLPSKSAKVVGSTARLVRKLTIPTQEQWREFYLEVIRDIASQDNPKHYSKLMDRFRAFLNGPMTKEDCDTMAKDFNKYSTTRMSWLRYSIFQMYVAFIDMLTPDDREVWEGFAPCDKYYVAISEKFATLLDNLSSNS